MAVWDGRVVGGAWVRIGAVVGELWFWRWVGEVLSATAVGIVRAVSIRPARSLSFQFFFIAFGFIWSFRQFRSFWGLGDGRPVLQFDAGGRVDDTPSGVGIPSGIFYIFGHFGEVFVHLFLVFAGGISAVFSVF